MGKPKLSLSEKLDLIFRIALIAPSLILLNILRCVSIAAWRGLPLKRYVTCGVVRVFLGGFTARQIQYLMPSTAEAYKTWMAKKVEKAGKSNDLLLAGRLRYDVEVLPDGVSSIQWVGDRRKATKFVLFLHGGGYVSPLGPGHLEWCLQSYIATGAAAGIEVAVLVLQYTFCPQGQYPVQLCQAAAAMGHLLDSGIQPGNIIFGGDSAGGNLTMELLSHIRHPHPAARPLKLEEPLAGAFMVSPWVSAKTNTNSFRENKYIDMLSPDMMTRASHNFLHGTSHEVEIQGGKGWAMSGDADDSWFDGMSKAIKHLYVTAGKQEVMRDHCVHLATTIKQRNADMDVRLEVAENEAHDFIVLEGTVEIVGDATRRMKAWAADVFAQ